MSRIDKSASSAEELEKVKSEIVSEVRRGTRRKGKGACALMLIALVLSAALWMAWNVAATGVVNVPVLTSLAYEPPAPTSVVEPGVPLESFVAARLATAGGTFSIPDSTLTTFVRDTLATSGQTLFDDQRAQAAALGARGIELYLPLRDNALGSAVVVHLRFGATDPDAAVGAGGGLTVAVDDASIGSWNAWRVIREGVLVPALMSGLSTVNQTLADQNVTVTGASEQNGFLVIQTSFSSP